LTLIGGAAFWLPDIALRWMPFTSRTLSSLLVLFVPLAFIGVWVGVARHKSFVGHSIGIPAFLLLGIWFFGPPAMTLGELPYAMRGADFELSAYLSMTLIAWIGFPLFTFMMSAYSSSMGGLLFVSFLLFTAILINAARRVANRAMTKETLPTESC